MTITHDTTSQITLPPDQFRAVEHYISAVHDALREQSMDSVPGYHAVGTRVSVIAQIRLPCQHGRPNLWDVLIWDSPAGWSAGHAVSADGTVTDRTWFPLDPVPDPEEVADAVPQWRQDDKAFTAVPAAYSTQPVGEALILAEILGLHYRMGRTGLSGSEHHRYAELLMTGPGLDDDIMRQAAIHAALAGAAPAKGAERELEEQVDDRDAVIVSLRSRLEQANASLDQARHRTTVLERQLQRYEPPTGPMVQTLERELGRVREAAASAQAEAREAQAETGRLRALAAEGPEPLRKVVARYVNCGRVIYRPGRGKGLLWWRHNRTGEPGCEPGVSGASATSADPRVGGE